MKAYPAIILARIGTEPLQQSSLQPPLSPLHHDGGPAGLKIDKQWFPLSWQSWWSSLWSKRIWFSSLKAGLTPKSPLDMILNKMGEIGNKKTFSNFQTFLLFLQEGSCQSCWRWFHPLVTDWLWFAGGNPVHFSSFCCCCCCQTRKHYAAYHLCCHHDLNNF